MTSAAHPREALFEGEAAPPRLAPCEHFAGNAERIAKAFGIQEKLGPIFDITCDCEDGAPAGREAEHARMIAECLAGPANRFARAGVRIHDPAHPSWKEDIDLLIEGAGASIAYITIPKPRSTRDAAMVIQYLATAAERHPAKPRIPVHVLIETHGALREVDAIAALPGVETLDFGLMDFVSAHHGAIPASAMRSPGQFEHRLLSRAKTLVVAAALAHGRVPSHNVTLDLKDPRTAFEDARRARVEFGFLRMYSIHPIQIQAIVDGMKPVESEVRLAADILLAAHRAGWGPVQHAGELYDRASYRYYWNVLERAHASGVALPEEAEKAFF